MIEPDLISGFFIQANSVPLLTLLIESVYHLINVIKGYVRHYWQRKLGDGTGKDSY
jgi:hypothetical protein